jgi:cyclic pyranopterin phosphate synthase
MVDVSAKSVTVREATATGRVRTSAQVVALLRDDGLPKGDALAVARVAGIAGAKRTPDLVPLCHPVALHAVTVDLEILDDAVLISATTRTRTDRGGDGGADRGCRGRPRPHRHDQGGGPVGVDHRHPAGVEERRPVRQLAEVLVTLAAGTRAAVITASNRSARGEREDTSGHLLADRLRELGCTVDSVTVVPDDVPAIQAALRSALADGADLVITTGGTGVTPTDVTPEATRPVLEREVPGIAEAIRLETRDRVPTSILSRGLAGTVGASLVVNLPGSPGGVKDGLDRARAHTGTRAESVARRRPQAGRWSGVTAVQPVLCEISTEPLSTDAHQAAVAGPASGAIVVFSGVVRDHDDGRSVVSLDYVGHPSAAEVLRACREEILADPLVHAVAVSHRIGDLQDRRRGTGRRVVGRHRAEAFAACERPGSTS